MENYKNNRKGEPYNIGIHFHVSSFGAMLLFLVLVGTACSEFVEVDPPKNILISETVFDNSATIESALANIYYKIREQGMVTGKHSGLTTSMAIYSDDLDYYGTDSNSRELYNHSVIAANTLVLGWWRNAYNIIYAANDIIKGLEKTTALSSLEKAPFMGQALFIRGYMHSLLVGLYGEIPYITTTDYLVNNTVARMPVNAVYDQIIEDLNKAMGLMEVWDTSEEHVIPDKYTAQALLARMYLYTEDWTNAEAMANDIIGAHSLELDINKVFLKNASGSLWQLKPNGVSYMNTYVANQMIINSFPNAAYALSNDLLEAFEPNDLRYVNWVGNITSSDGLSTLHYAYKYKAPVSEKNALEYAIVFRLAEQYLIRAEARAYLGNIIDSNNDLNMIRNRAGLPDIELANSEELKEAILKERRVELFTEFGHRWFDLVRTGKANSVLSHKPGWKASDVLLPIPETELELNPNLNPQNLGY